MVHTLSVLSQGNSGLSNIVVLQALVHTSILSRLIIILHSIYLKDDLIEGFLMGVNHSVDIFDVH